MHDSISSPQLVKLCGACPGVVWAGGRCGTCGHWESDSPQTPVDPGVLLDRVWDALAAQSALARKTAAERLARAHELYEQTVRLRRQATVLRSLVSERPDLRTTLERLLCQVDRVLAERAEQPSSSPRRPLDILLPRDPTCAAVARRLLEDQLDGGVDRTVVDNAKLIATELVTNALVHGKGRIGLRSRIDGDRLRIEVTDEGEGGRLEPIVPPGHGLTGHGLWLFDQLSVRWGSDSAPTRVWAEVSLSGHARPA